MRNVFLALIFANLAYFAWARLVDTPRPPPVNESVAKLPRLKLASELPDWKPAGSKAEKTALRESGACVSVGPFTDPEGSARAAEVLRTKGFSPQPRVETGALPEYWVYLGGLKTDAEADKQLKSLQHFGFKDAEILPDSAEGRRISIGLFHDRGGAEQRLWAARLKGFDPELSERQRPATLYWVDVAAPNVSTVAVGEVLSTGGSKVPVQPCGGSLPPTATARQSSAPAQQPATAAISKVP